MTTRTLIIRNIDEARSSGFEGDLAWLPVTGLSLDFAVGLLDTEMMSASLPGVDPIL